MWHHIIAYRSSIAIHSLLSNKQHTCRERSEESLFRWLPCYNCCHFRYIGITVYPHDPTTSKSSTVRRKDSVPIQRTMVEKGTTMFYHRTCICRLHLAFEDVPAKVSQLEGDKSRTRSTLVPGSPLTLEPLPRWSVSDSRDPAEHTLTGRAPCRNCGMKTVWSWSIEVW